MVAGRAAVGVSSSGAAVVDHLALSRLRCTAIPPAALEGRAANCRLPPCLVGMDACATAHDWGHELMALGHDIRLMPPLCLSETLFGATHVCSASNPEDRARSGHGSSHALLPWAIAPRRNEGLLGALAFVAHSIGHIDPPATKPWQRKRPKGYELNSIDPSPPHRSAPRVDRNWDRSGSSRK
jgi:hypothetical protein